jgi:hypothetical protein
MLSEQSARSFRGSPAPGLMGLECVDSVRRRPSVPFFLSLPLVWLNLPMRWGTSEPSDIGSSGPCRSSSVRSDRPCWCLRICTGPTSKRSSCCVSGVAAAAGADTSLHLPQRRSRHDFPSAFAYRSLAERDRRPRRPALLVRQEAGARAGGNDLGDRRFWPDPPNRAATDG